VHWLSIQPLSNLRGSLEARRPETSRLVGRADRGRETAGCQTLPSRGAAPPSPALLLRRPPSTTTYLWLHLCFFLLSPPRSVHLDTVSCRSPCCRASAPRIPACSGSLGTRPACLPPAWVDIGCCAAPNLLIAAALPPPVHRSPTRRASATSSRSLDDEALRDSSLAAIPLLPLRPAVASDVVSLSESLPHPWVCATCLCRLVDLSRPATYPDRGARSLSTANGDAGDRLRDLPSPPSSWNPDEGGGTVSARHGSAVAGLPGPLDGTSAAV